MQCYDANWWGSMDNEGWSKCDTGSVLDGFKVTPLDALPPAYGPLYFLEVGRCCKYTSNPAGTSCTNANWWNTFDVAGWSSCPAGSYISGLYRNANWCQGISCLEEVSCCPISGPTTCIEYPVDLKSKAAANKDPNANLYTFTCPHGMVLNGLYRTSENDLGGITKFKCCSVGGTPTPSATAPTSAACVDTPGWKNNFGFGCAAYASHGWCANGGFPAGMEWTGKVNGPGKAGTDCPPGTNCASVYNNPGSNCCVCGKA